MTNRESKDDSSRPKVKLNRIKDITAHAQGEHVLIYAKVVEARQTKGPLVLTITDGTGTIDAILRKVRIDIKPEAVVKLQGVVSESRGAAEIDVRSLQLMSGENADALIRKIKDRLEHVLCSAKFMILSDIYSDLESRFVKVRGILTSAMAEHRPIIIKHHDDADGFCAGLALEHALRSKVEGTSMLRKISRSSIPSPMYQVIDALHDVDDLAFLSGSSTPRGIVIILDNGTGLQDSAAISLLKSHGISVVVIDHHPLGDTDNALHPLHIADVLINPCLNKPDNDVTAGMLASELASMINPDCRSYAVCAAVSGIADKTQGAHYDEYLKLCISLGFDEKLLLKMTYASAYETWCYRSNAKAHSLRSMLFSAPELAASLAEPVYSVASDLTTKATDAALELLQTENIGSTTLAIIELRMINMRYPSAGKITGLVFDNLKQDADNASDSSAPAPASGSICTNEKQAGSAGSKNLLCIGLGPDFACIRISGLDLDVNNVVRDLKQMYPAGLVDGGGHAVAGTVKFSPVIREKVMDYLRSCL